MKSVRAAWWIWALVPLLVVSALLLIGAKAHAAPMVESISSDGQPMKLRLLRSPCGEKVLVHLRGKIKPEVLRRFKAAVLTWQGKVYASCWIELGGAIYSIDETGDPLQPIQRSHFRDDSV